MGAAPSTAFVKVRPRRRRFLRQRLMDNVLLALLPVLVGGVYFFGWRVLAMVLWVTLVGCGVEYRMAGNRGDPLTEACLVTCALFALSLPPTLPFWMAAVGIVVAIGFGKEVFGGFGRNVFNPAVVGRGFLFVCFPVAMTGRFAPVWHGGAAGLVHWGPRRMIEGVNAVSAATPMWARRDFGWSVGLSRLVTGDIGQLFAGNDGVRRALAAGSVGEVSALLVLAGGLFLLVKKTANWRLVASSLGGAVAATVLFRNVLGISAVPPLLWTLCSGALLYACFFMVTDPVSAPKHRPAQYLYGAFIGAMIILLRWKAVFAGGVAFAILLGNTVGPTLELFTRAHARRREARKMAVTSGPGP
ncbi:MAG: RnfABCDGE type electron transport complex subunit D [Kiritimatiellaeota bacterium]|nr:RnfABCDGE type electron transport complex subunit D [Kiritimatiellota bacterium]